MEDAGRRAGDALRQAFPGADLADRKDRGWSIEAPCGHRLFKADIVLKDQSAKTVFLLVGPTHGSDVEVFNDYRQASLALTRLARAAEGETTAVARLARVGVAGWIALVITAAIVYVYVARHESPPDILSNALTIILGFYFGRQSKVLEAPRSSSANSPLPEKAE